MSGTSAAVAGWAFDNVGMNSVEVYVDDMLRGAATLGVVRPDVVTAYPHMAPDHSGWSYTLDTTALANGSHTIVVHMVDSNGNEGLLAPVPFTVNN